MSAVHKDLVFTNHIKREKCRVLAHGRKMFRLFHETVATQSLTRFFFRSLASFERFGQYKNDFIGGRKPRKSKPKGKGSAEENRRISNIFYRLLTKNNLKLERIEGSQFEITAKDLALACREQHSLYITNEKFKLKKPITSFGSHNVDMRMNIMDGVVPLTVTVKKLNPGAEESSEKLQHSVEVDKEDIKSNERGPKILEAVKAV